MQTQIYFKNAHGKYLYYYLPEPGSGILDDGYTMYPPDAASFWNLDDRCEAGGYPGVIHS